MGPEYVAHPTPILPQPFYLRIFAIRIIGILFVDWHHIYIMFNANNNPAETKNGKSNHPKNIIVPAATIKIWRIVPVIIKTKRQIAPKNREKKLEIRVSKNSLISKPLG